MKSSKAFIFKILILNLFLVTSSASFSQSNTLPPLETVHFKEDWNTFIQIISDFNPQLEVRQLITGRDILYELKKMERKIDNCLSTKDFILQLNKALNICSDQHATHNSFYFPETSSSLKEINQKYANIIFDNEISNMINWQYINGKYYNINRIEILDRESKQAKDTIKPSTLALSINHKSFSDFFNNTYSQYDNRIRWNNNLKEYYYSSIVMDLTKYKEGIIIKWNNNKTTKQGISGDIFSTNSCEKSYPRFVHYFRNNEILYISLPQMTDSKFYKKQIKKYRNKKIRKIVIDIRGNGGGSDKVWKDLLSYIINKPLRTDVCLAFRNTPAIWELAKLDSSQLVKDQQSCLKDSNYIFFSQEEEICPDKRSLNYTGNIYLLVDEFTYSAAASLKALAENHINLITVGKQSGWLGGRGVTPIVFNLPNTKFSFMLEPAIDMTGVEKPIDIYHDKIEIDLKIPIDTLIMFKNQIPENKNIEFIKKHDPYYKKIVSE